MHSFIKPTQNKMNSFLLRYSFMHCNACMYLGCHPYKKGVVRFCHPTELSVLFLCGLPPLYFQEYLISNIRVPASSLSCLNSTVPLGSSWLSCVSKPHFFLWLHSTPCTPLPSLHVLLIFVPGFYICSLPNFWPQLHASGICSLLQTHIR